MTIYITPEEFTNETLGKLQKASGVVVGADEKNALELMKRQQIKEGEICLYHPLVEDDGALLSMEELLLDERYAEGILNIPMEAFEKCGYINEILPAKRRYELMVRLAESYPLRGFWCEEVPEIPEEAEEDIYRAECFMVGKYSHILQKTGCFDGVVQALLEQAELSEDKEERIQVLERMLSHKDDYWKIADATAPILLYYGVTYCYNIMNVMMEQLANVLRELGERVICYDEQAEDVAGLSRFVDCRFKAVVGIQTYLMSVYMKESDYFLHDKIIGPKFNIILDHPVWMKGQLEQVPSDYYVLTHDENYKNFVDTYYPKVSGTYLFPPAGKSVEVEGINSRQERQYELTFIGTYGDYRKKCEVIYRSHKSIRYLANRFLLTMRKDTKLTAEEALEKTLAYYGIEPEKEAFLQLFYEMRSVIQCVMYYYREKVVDVLLKSGVKVDIWGDSWEASPMAKHPNLVIHKEVLPEESLRILNQSKLSLNVMAWHKGGFTERMANTMLSGAVLVTDETTYCPNKLKNRENCVMFSLDNLQELPIQIKELLQDEKERTRIAEAGIAYAREYHTWEQRAKQLLSIIGEIK